MVCAAAALMAAAFPFAAFFADNSAEVVGIGNVLIAFLIGLVPFSVLFVLQRTFYALGDTRTPFFLTSCRSILFVIGALAAGTYLPEAADRRRNRARRRRSQAPRRRSAP